MAKRFKLFGMGLGTIVLAAGAGYVLYKYVLNKGAEPQEVVHTREQLLRKANLEPAGAG